MSTRALSGWAPVALCSALLCLLAAPCVGRTWTNDQGQTLEADFVRLRGKTAILRADGKSIPAPIDRLSEEDQAWIDGYKALLEPRQWSDTNGAGGATAEYLDLDPKGIEVRHDGKKKVLPFARLTTADWRHVASVFAYLDQEPPEFFVEARASASPIDPPKPPENPINRDWTDVDGRKISAAFGGVEGKNVLLWMKGRRYVLPLARFSEEDQTWVANQNAAKLVTDLQGGWAFANALIAKAAERANAGPNAQLGGPPPEFGGPNGQFGPGDGFDPRRQQGPQGQFGQRREFGDRGGFQGPPGSQAPPRSQGPPGSQRPPGFQGEQDFRDGRPGFQGPPGSQRR